MIKKGPVERICMCCGERKKIEHGATYCKECSTSTFGMGIIDTTPTPGKKQGLYTIKSII